MRPALATVDLDALRHNYRHARVLGGGKALAVVKADAYGHGAVRCAQALAAEADGFGVACIEEALELREAGIRQPILLLEGFFDLDELALIDTHALWTVVAAPWQVEALERHRLSRPLQVWLKLDSGMHRLGLAPTEYRDAWRRLRALPWVGDIVAMTHLARADEFGHPSTTAQLNSFDAALSCLPSDSAISIANSAGLMAWPRSRRGWVRPGLMLYGSHTIDTHRAELDALRPVIHVESSVIATRELDAGEPIGYGAAYFTGQPTRVGVVAMGYADGYPQYAPAGTPVLVDGKRSRLIGRVSMDMLTIDLTDLPGTGLGSRVELWGRHLPMADVAAHARSSPYQLMTGLKRVPRRYLGG